MSHVLAFAPRHNERLPPAMAIGISVGSVATQAARDDRLVPSEPYRARTGEYAGRSVRTYVLTFHVERLVWIVSYLPDDRERAGAGETASDADATAAQRPTTDAHGGPFATVMAIVDTVREKDVPFDAAAVTYYALASFLPLLIVSLAVLSLVGASDALVSFLRESASASTADVVDEAVGTTRGRGGAGAIGLLVAAWSASKIFRGLSKAFDRIYGDEQTLSILGQVRQALVVLAFLVVAFAVASVAGAATALVPLDIPYPSLVYSALGLVGLVLGLLPLFYVLPPRSVSVRHALPGAVVAAVGWVVLQQGFSLYAQNAGTYAAYGFLGAILLFVVLLYFANTILLIGAATNATLDPRR